MAFPVQLHHNQFSSFRYCNFTRKFKINSYLCCIIRQPFFFKIAIIIPKYSILLFKSKFGFDNSLFFYSSLKTNILIMLDVDIEVEDYRDNSPYKEVAGHSDSQRLSKWS